MQIHSHTEKTPTILVFDSGVGGLSVYGEIRKLLPDINYIYAFDNAGFPYGNKSESFIIERVINTVEYVASRYPLDLVVIACNTASTSVLPALRERFKFPVVGVVPAIKPAVLLTKNGVVGLLATKGTVTRSYTHTLIKEFAADCKVELLGSSRLVEMAEDKLHGKAIDLEELREIFVPWLQLKTMPDVIVLGCTHFPLIIEELRAVLPQGIQFVDSGAAIARRVAALVPCDDKIENRDKRGLALCTSLDGYADSLHLVLKDYHFNELKEYQI